MLLKLIGTLLVIAASGMLGYVLSRDCARRPQEIRILQGLLQMLENEISFLSNTLAESFYRISRMEENGVARFFMSAAGFIDNNSGYAASAAWEKAVGEQIGNTALTKEDEDILLSFGKMLGSSDLEGQIKNIRLTLEQLKIQEQKAEEARRKNETMYRSLGILGGMAIVIILF